MNEALFKQLGDKYPFLSVCEYVSNEYIGIIANQDSNVTSIYDFGQLPTRELKEKFLELGETWWWESNRTIPINLFFKGDWRIFKPYTRILINKNLQILSGPVTSLNNISCTRRKRRSITVIKRMD